MDAQPNYVYHALALAPNDTHFGHLWGLGATPGVDVLPAWDRSRGAGQVIAIVDTGVDLTHPDLAGNLWTGPGGVHGHDFVDNDNDPDDFNMHGTHVAGTAAAIADNALGVAGVAPQAQIMAVRVLDGDGLGSTTSIANGIAFAAANGAGVINLSLGGPAGAGDQTMQAAIAQAEESNAVVVAAAGNEANNNDVNPDTPCTLPNGNLICVAAVTRTGARSELLELRRHHRRPGGARRRRKRRPRRRHPEREAGVGPTVQRGFPERHGRLDGLAHIRARSTGASPAAASTATPPRTARAARTRTTRNRSSSTPRST